MKLFKNLGIVSASLTFICLSGSNVLPVPVLQTTEKVNQRFTGLEVKHENQDIRCVSFCEHSLKIFSPLETRD